MRNVQSWKTPSRAYISCLATAHYDMGLRGKNLVAAVKHIVPRWKGHFDKPPTDNALVQRADKSRRIKSEAPEINLVKKPLWKKAKSDAKRSVCTFDFRKP